MGAGELGLPEPEETGATFAANAELKARAAADASGHPALADDFGLWRGRAGRRAGNLFGALGGSDKGFPRRHGAESKKNCWKGTRTIFRPNSSARLRWRCRHGEIKTFEGEVHGHLTFPPRGEHGFGYDPIFIADGMSRLSARSNPQ